MADDPRPRTAKVTGAVRAVATVQAGDERSVACLDALSV
ncbi:hypothetical protein DER29_6221 [Micromonospora sp. M71_S20]|nr:hypothetical protein DER29_6221 [Micromonospora sp. M71_S20]